MAWSRACRDVTEGPPAVPRPAALHRGVWGVSSQGGAGPKPAPVSRGTGRWFYPCLFMAPGRSTALCAGRRQRTGPCHRARPWANPPTLTAAPFTDAGHGTHVLTCPEETWAPPRVRTGRHVCLTAGVPGRVGERRGARPQAEMRGDGAPSAAQRARGREPGVLGGDMPATLSSGPGSQPRQPAGSPRVLAGASTDRASLRHPRRPTGGKWFASRHGNQSSEGQSATCP